jgi:hypothetical protein
MTRLLIGLLGVGPGMCLAVSLQAHAQSAQSISQSGSSPFSEANDGGSSLAEPRPTRLGDPTEPPAYPVWVAVEGGILLTRQTVLDREGIGQPFAFGLTFGAALVRYLRVEIGFGGLDAPDKTTCAGSACAQDTAGVAGTTFWGELGSQYRILFASGDRAWGLLASGSIGVRGSHGVSRKESGNLDSQPIHLKTGPYIAPALVLYPWSAAGKAVPTPRAIGLVLKYEYYLSGDVTSGFWGGLRVEFW